MNTRDSMFVTARMLRWWVAVLLLLVMLAALIPFAALAADRVATIDLSTATDQELQNRVSTCTLPVDRVDGTALTPAEITSIHWYTCDNCAKPNDAGNEPDSAYTLKEIVVGNTCSWKHDVSGYKDGDTQVIRAVAEASDGAGGTKESVLSPDRGFLVFAGIRPLAAPSPVIGIQP